MPTSASQHAKIQPSERKFSKITLSLPWWLSGGSLTIMRLPPPPARRLRELAIKVAQSTTLPEEEANRLTGSKAEADPSPGGQGAFTMPKAMAKATNLLRAFAGDVVTTTIRLLIAPKTRTT